MSNTFKDSDWLKGYMLQTRYLKGCPKRVGWARGKSIVKKNIRFWAIPLYQGLGDAQKGMIDALLDSVGC